MTNQSQFNTLKETMMTHARRILLEFPDTGVSVQASLLEESAPRTVEAIWSRLPADGSVQHGIYSGSEVYFLFDKTFIIQPENATSAVLPGDVGYYYQPGGRMYGYPADLCEICLFYDRDALPSMPGGPVQVNVFARMEGDTAPFFDQCRRMRLEGQKSFRVTRVID
jgi:hypothetical protein